MPWPFTVIESEIDDVSESVDDGTDRIVKALDRNTAAQVKTAVAIDNLRHGLDFWGQKFYELIKAELSPPRPGRLQIRVVSQTVSGGKKMLKFDVILPPPSAADVTKRALTITVGGATPQTVDLAGDALEATGFEGEDNDAVVLSLVDTDDAGNPSPAREQTLTLVDNLAPAQPGEMGLRVTSES